MIESEKTLEARLVAEVKKRGGMALKFTSQFHRGIPDRLVLLRYHTLAFVEMKSTGETTSKLQEVAIRQLRTLGFHVFVIDRTEDLEYFLACMDRRLARIEADVERTKDDDWYDKKMAAAEARLKGIEKMVRREV